MVRTKSEGVIMAREHSEKTAIKLLEEYGDFVLQNTKADTPDQGWDLEVYTEYGKYRVDVKAMSPSIEHGIGWFKDAYIEIWAGGYSSSLYNPNTDYWLLFRDYTENNEQFYEAYLIPTYCLRELVDRQTWKKISKNNTKYKQIDSGGYGVLIPWDDIKANSLESWRGYYGENN